MPESLEKRIEKLETELATLKQDYLYICALVGNTIGFIKNMHGIVDLSDQMTNRIIGGWTEEVDKRDSITDLFKSLKDRFLGGSDGPTNH